VSCATTTQGKSGKAGSRKKWLEIKKKKTFSRLIRKGCLYIVMLHDRTWVLLGRKMTGEARPEELRELEEILKNDPELYFSLHAIAELWHRNPPDTSGESQEAYQAHLQRMKERGIQLPVDLAQPNDQEEITDIPPPRNIPTTRMLIGFITISLIAFVIYVTAALVMPEPQPGPPSISEISTPRGSRISLTVPDGTRIRLNSGSTLSYGKNFGDKVRELTLSGEAWFEVTRKLSKPLIVHTSSMDIRVVSTRFNIKSYPEDHSAEAILLNGSIEATLNNMKGRKINMQPNEKLTIRNGLPESTDSSSSGIQAANETMINLVQLSRPAADSIIPELAWLNDMLIFNDISFKELTGILGRWYDLDFQFEDHSLEALSFTGSFTNQPITAVLDSLRFPNRFKYRIQQKMVFITRPE